MGNRIENQYEVLESILAGVKKPRDLPLALLEDITEHFSEERKIGEGGFGMVYKGLLRNGEMVAVKKIWQAIPSSQTQFENEVNLLMKLKHENIVRLVGYCYETRHLHMPYEGKSVFAGDTESLLCLEYLPNGSLDKYISDASSGLNWHTRSKIIEGISYGLQYLHENSNEPIIHLDLKPANILLDAKMFPKITDFGLSRLFDQNKTIDTATTRGTLGYMSPEFLRGTITPMSDIFSLGVIIMEELQKWRNRLEKEPVNTSLETDCQRIERCIQIGLICVNPERTKRPTMKKIINMLEGFESMNLYNEASCSVELTNDTSNSIAINIQTPSKQYIPQPDKGIVLPGHKRGVKRTLQPEESTAKVRNADKFIMQSTKAKEVLADEDIIAHMFSSKKVVDEVNLTVVYEPEKYQVDMSLDRQEEEVSKGIASISYENTRGMYFHPVENISWNLATSLTSNRTVDVSTGVIGSLLPKLSELLNKYNLETSVRRDVDYVIQELRVMRADLCNVSEVQWDNNNEQIKLAKLSVCEVRELSYDIEDAVDGFLTYVDGSEPATSTGGLEDVVRGFLTPATSTGGLMELIQEIGGAIKDIKNKVQNKAGWKGKYKVKEVVANTVSTINAHHLSALANDSSKLVGINDAMNDFTKRLRGVDGKELKVHSIFGTGGLGKTTLARAVYNQLKGSFHVTAFVPVGRNPDLKKLLYDILFELDEERYINLKAANLDERQLINVLTKLLENNRYLIVIDDMWDKKIWHDLIKFAFVDSKCGSKVIITTRIFDVAAIATDVYKLDQLSPGYSEELFYATLSPEEGRGQYDVTPEVLNKILVKCGGVPLAIITIASLLASKQRDDWPKVYNSIGFGHEVNEVAENTRKILLFSYSDLPRHLRTCLLHLSIYPEDKMIWKDIAIWQWVAEGFVHEEPGRGLFELGERYFNQLVSRSMIQLVVVPFSDVIRFRIHDLVLDMVCSLSKDENFVTVLETDKQLTSSKNNARRLAVQKRGIGKLDPLDCMVQLRSFCAIGCNIKLIPPLSSFKVLRVLSLESHRFNEFNEDTLYHLEHIGKLLQLRYLTLDAMYIDKLPEEIGDLLFLQTLILNNTGIQELPHSVGLLRQLKCLRISNLFFEAPNWLVNMTTLEDLSLTVTDVPLVFAEGLSNLKELRNLKIRMLGLHNDNVKKALVKSIGNLLNLQSLQIFYPLDSGYISSDDNWEGFVPHRHLHSITMEVRFSSVPPWMDPTRLLSLFYLSLRLYTMEARCLEILGRLPELHTLKLDIRKGSWLTVRCNGAFPKLRQLSSTRTMLSFQQAVMPRLEYLELTVFEGEMREANFDCDFTSLGNLPFLQKLIFHLYGCEDPGCEYAKRMEASVKHALDRHPHHRPIPPWPHPSLGQHLYLVMMVVVTLISELI